MKDDFRSDHLAADKPAHVRATPRCMGWFTPGKVYLVDQWNGNAPYAFDDDGDLTILGDGHWDPAPSPHVQPVSVSDTSDYREPLAVELTFGPLPEVDHVSPTGGLRRNAGKLAVHLIPPVLIRAVASVLGIGAKKYAARNWELGMEYSVAYASLQRHALAFWSGEDVDPESGEHHMAHVATNAAFLLEYARRVQAGTLPARLDDRPRDGADEVLTAFAEYEARL